MRKKTKAQSILEYVLVLAIVAVALTTMQVYFKRGLQAAIKLSADELAEQQDGGDEIDPTKGIKVTSSSNLQTITSGALADNRNLPEGATARVQTFRGGARRTDVYRLTETTGTSNYQTEKKEE